MGQRNKRRASISSSSPVKEGATANEGSAYLEPFIHQVGGHVSVLRWDERTVCKPYSTREHNFYQMVAVILKPLLSFLPEFKGIIEVSLVEDDAGYLSLTALPAKSSTGEPEKHTEHSKTMTPARTTKIKLKRSGSLELECCGHVEETFQDVGAITYPQNPWAIRCQTSHIAKLRRKNKDRHQFLVLENLVFNYRYPCILDLKMGTQPFGDDAPEAKRQSQKAKIRGSTSELLGARMCGLQVYQRRSGVFKCHNKYYGRRLSVDGFKDEIRTFLHNGETFRVDVIDIFLQKLQALLQVLDTAEGCRFYTSSLLLLYDGADNTTVDKSPPRADIRMIDFEHSILRDSRSDRTHEGLDRGFIFGVRSLIDILQELAANNDECISRRGSQEKFCDTSSVGTCCSTTDESISELI